MARRRGRRRRRRSRIGGKRRGFGSNNKTKKKKKKKVNRARRKLRNKIRSKKLKSRVKSVKKAVAKNKQKTKKKSRLKSIRSAISNTVSKVKKGFSMGGKAYGKAAKSVGKAVGKATRGAAAHASTLSNTKPKSKLKTQISNFRSRVKQMSTPEAKKKRKYDRLKRQHGLDYSRMNDSFKANVNVSQAYKHLGLDRYAPTRAVYNRLPKAVKNFSWKHQFKAPTKLGVRDGYRAPNRGPVRGVPGGIVRDMIGGQRAAQAAQAQAQQQEQAANRQRLADQVARSSHPEFVHSRREAAGLPSLRIGMRKPPRMGPQQDWLGSLYNRHNISGGKLDQEARDYWSNEAKTKGRRATRDAIIGTSKAQGTYGGRKKPTRLLTGLPPARRRGGGGIWGLGIGLAGRGLRGHVDRKGSRRNLGKTLAASAASFGLRGG